MGRLGGPIRATVGALREAMANEGIRRLEVAWTAGISADAALLVVLLVVVFEREGAVATGLLGAFRMVPAVVAGMLSGGAIFERVAGRPLLLAIGLIRAASAVLVGVVVAVDGPTAALFVLAAVAAAAGAPVRPVQATLMPALARSPSELVASNMAWSTGEGLGSFAGPFFAGILLAAGADAGAALVAAALFGITVLAVAGLRFELASAATGGAGHLAGGLRLLDGLRTRRRRPVPRWTMVTVFGQVLTRGLLSTPRSSRRSSSSTWARAASGC